VAVDKAQSVIFLNKGKEFLVLARHGGEGNVLQHKGQRDLVRERLDALDTLRADLRD
jgi:hypothetical protein